MALGPKLVVHLVVNHVADVAQIVIDIAAGRAEPFIQVEIQNGHAPKHQEENGQEAERERAADQFALNMRSDALALPFHVKLDRGTEEIETQRDRQDKD